jgi:hypothetical protein
MGQPAIKASYFLGNVAGLSALPPEEEREARRRLAAVITSAEAKSRADWVPLACDLELTHVVHQLGGTKAVQEVNRRSFLAALEGPLMRPFFTGAVSLFGLTPRALMKMAPRAFAGATRDMGRLVFESIDDRSAAFLHMDLPEALHGDEIWLSGFCGVLQATYDSTKHTGVSSLELVRGGQACRYRGRWRPLAGDVMAAARPLSTRP